MSSHHRKPAPSISIPFHLIPSLLILWLIPSAHGFCPNGCLCVNAPVDQIAADCSRAELKNIPMFLNPRLKYLNLQGNQLSSLTMDELSFYPELRELDLSANQILSVERGAFASLSKLTTLSLAQNLLSALELDTFKGLVSLRDLDLSDNTISRLATSVFVELASLEKLNISFNDVSDVSPGAFTGLDYLTHLWMHNNKLSVIPRIALHAPTNLVHLTLAHNQLQNLQNESLILLQNLKHLDLSRNLIDSIEMNAFVGLHNLRQLNMRSNMLYRVPSSSLRVLTDLSQLDLSDNRIDELDTSCLDGLANLQELTIDHCKSLKAVHMNAFSGLFKLQTLNLNNNMLLHNIHDRAFEQPIELRHLHLANNNLQHLSANLLNWSMITELDVRGNPWVCDCALAWMGEDTIKHLHEQDGLKSATCAMPEDKKGSSLAELAVSSLSCGSLVPANWLHLGLFALMLTSVTVLIVIVCRFHDKLCCASRKRHEKCPTTDCLDVERTSSSSSNMYTRSDLAAILANEQSSSPFYSGGSINPKLAAIQNTHQYPPLGYLQNPNHSQQHLLYSNFGQSATLGAQFYSSAPVTNGQPVFPAYTGTMAHAGQTQVGVHQQGTLYHGLSQPYAPPSEGSGVTVSSGYLTSRSSAFRNVSPPIQYSTDGTHVYSAIGDSPRSLRSDAALLPTHGNGYHRVNTCDS